MTSSKLYLREFIFGLNLFSIGQFHPDLEEPIINKRRIIIHFITWFIMEISFAGGIFEAGDFNEVILTFAVACNQLLSIIKYLTFIMNRFKVHNMIKLIEVDGISYSKKSEFVKKSLKDSKLILLGYILVTTMTASTYGVGATVEEDEFEQPRMWELTHIYIPYDFVIYKRIGALRLTAVCLGVYHAYCEMFLDILSASLFTHIGRQFEAVGDLFSRINFDPLIEDGDSYQILNNAIEYHKAVLKCAADLQSMFSLCFMAQIIESCLPLCFCLFLLVRTLTTGEGKLIDMVSHATYVLYLVYQLYLMTRCAHLSSERASQVADGVYMSNWYLANPDTRRMLSWIIRRAQYPVRYTALSMFPVTIDTFIQILKTAYAAFTLMTNI